MIRSQTALAGEYTYVSRLDDALDRDAPDFSQAWDQYLDGVRDAPIKAGGTPTVFHLRHLKAREMNQLVRDGANGFDLCRAAMVGMSGAPIEGYRFKLVADGDAKVANIDEAPGELWPVFVEVGGRVLARMAPRGK